MSEPINVKGRDEFKKLVIDSEIPVLVDFWASWCMPCRMMSPILDDLSKDYAGKLKIAKVDTELEENMDLAYIFQIQSIPNMKLFKSGKVIKEYLGYRPKDIFIKEISSEI